MIVFVIPLKSKAVSKDWTLTTSLLKQTLQSVSNQSSTNHRTIVVCHDLPEIKVSNFDKVEFVQVEFPVPDNQSASEMRADKERKLRVGLDHAMATHCSYIMKLDADDLVHRDLVSYASKSTADILVVNQGILLKQDAKWYQYEDQAFHRICGSSSIFKVSALAPDARRENLPGVRNLFISDNHERIEELSRKLALSVDNPPFPAVCYCLSADSRLSDMYHPDHKDSLRMIFGRLRRMRLLTQRTKSMFNLT